MVSPQDDHWHPAGQESRRAAGEFRRAGQESRRAAGRAKKRRGRQKNAVGTGRRARFALDPDVPDQRWVGKLETILESIWTFSCRQRSLP